MTVATVYRELRQSGLIELKPGAGTYVGDGHSSDGLRSAAMRKLQRRIDGLFNEAEELGLAPSLVASLVNARAARGRLSLRPLRLLMVGNFIDTTQQYVDFIRGHQRGRHNRRYDRRRTRRHRFDDASLRPMRDIGAPARRGREPVARRHPGRRAEFHSCRGNTRPPRHDRPHGANWHRVDFSRVHGADETRRPSLHSPRFRRRGEIDHRSGPQVFFASASMFWSTPAERNGSSRTCRQAGKRSNSAMCPTRTPSARR